MLRLITSLFFLLPLTAAMASESLRVDGARLNETMETMKTFGGNAEGGSDRVAYGDHNKRALLYLANLMSEAGLLTRTDVAGNLIGFRPGTDDTLAPLVTGSHIDTVPNGGHYDGIVGVMAGIEVARTLHEAGISLRHGFEVGAWANEEKGKHGSRSIGCQVQAEELQAPSYVGGTIADGIRALGGDPDRIAENCRPPGSIAAYLEYHVEQGGVLEEYGVDIGVVTGIVGIRRWKIRFDGVANHAGSTPMNQRQDALLAAAEFILAVRRIVTTEPGRQVGTIGAIEAFPGAANVIPGAAELDLEMRDLSLEKLDRLFDELTREGQAIAEATETRFSAEPFYLSQPAESDERIMAAVRESAAALELSSSPMASGAGHDAQSFKTVGPLGMIFVPSRGGISHAPDEYTAPGAISNGANVLLQSLLRLDQAID